MSNLNNIPSGWKETTLGKVCDVQSGGTPSTKITSFWNGSIGWITPKDLSQYKDVFIEKGERSITKEGLENSSAKLLPKHTILFSSRAPIGYVVIAKNEISTNQGFKNLICDEQNSHYKFFYYLLKLKSDYIEKLSSGSTFSEASASLIKSIEVNIPKNIEEQKSIANILIAFDNKIEHLKSQNKTLEQTAQTIFKEWFGKYKVGDELPDRWRVGNLDEVMEFTNGYAFKSKDLLNEPQPNCLKVFKMGDIKKGGGFNHNKTKSYFPKEDAQLISKYILKNGDLLMSMTDMKDAISLLGHTALMIYDDEYIVNQRVGLIRAKNKINIDYPFLYLLTNDKHFIANLRGRANSGVQVNLSTQAIKESLFNIPDIDTNKKFNDLVQPLFEKRKHNYIAIQSLKKTRDTLLPRLMSGQLRVSEFKD